MFNGTGLFALDIYNIACSGDCSAFSLTNTFAGIVGGGSAVGTVNFLAQNPLVYTNYSATYTLRVGDAAGVFGANKNTNIENLTLTVTAAVPEPSEWAMMIAGLGIVGLIARKRRQTQG